MKQSDPELVGGCLASGVFLGCMAIAVVAKVTLIGLGIWALWTYVSGS